MKKISIFLFVLVATLSIQRASAHAVWIQADPKANKNQAHEVKVFYGEYSANEIEPTDKWYSDLKSLELWLTSPSGQKTKLALSDASVHLASSFIPTEDGLYYLTVVHATKDLGGTTKYEFSSVTTVLSGKAASVNVPVPQVPLSVVAEPKSYNPNKEIQLQVWKAGVASAKSEVIIMSPKGWTRTLITDDKGQVRFTPDWKGRYVVEVSDSKRETGEWNGKQFTSTWKGSTTSIIVN